MENLAILIAIASVALSFSVSAYGLRYTARRDELTDIRRELAEAKTALQICRAESQQLRAENYTLYQKVTRLEDIAARNGGKL